ncbi:ferredoxin-2, mitochondrial isoform X2 [Parasteatoda tepidariorum]|uniref:ferredoxin-2, mitochondrial isoform X2 n=1 Tax=Parasteatoda tepidariorum TaxID=114398 RepID=UPI00077FD26D|nr:ferredoxin-2, mitochondrial isoform X2 [Parasteatoda tepidariorum]
MFFCVAFLRNILNIAKISSSSSSCLYFHKLCFNKSKEVYVCCQINYALMNLFSSAPQRTLMSTVYSLRNCHSFDQGIVTQKTSKAEQETSMQAILCDGVIKEQVPDEKVKIYFETAKGEKIECFACANKNVMNASIENDIAMHGNCNGEQICSVCHVYTDEKYQEFMPKISEDEAEMLDMVPNVQENSRLSCQIIVKKELEGAVFKLPHYNGPSYEDPEEK